jgi:plasmid stability protein
MAQLTIRQLDESIVARLRERAAAAGHSMEQEVREILAAATTADPVAAAARLRARLASYGSQRFSDSGELVRSMRDERSGLA